MGGSATGAGSATSTCSKNVCTCDHGTGAVGPASGFTGSPGCDTNNTASCASCDRGYHITLVSGKQTCTANTCSCPNGIAVLGGTTCSETGDCCTDHQAIRCSSCNVHFHMAPNDVCKFGSRPIAPIEDQVSGLSIDASMHSVEVKTPAAVT